MSDAIPNPAMLVKEPDGRLTWEHQAQKPVRSMRLLDDKAMMDWLDKNVEHLNPHQGAPAATNISVMLNGGHFTAREAITLCMTEAREL